MNVFGYIAIIQDDTYYTTTLLVPLFIVLFIFVSSIIWFKRMDTTTTTTTTTSTTPTTPVNNNHPHLASGGLFTIKEHNTLSIICNTIISSDVVNDADTLFDNLDQKTITNIKEFYARSSNDLDLATHFLKLVATKPRSNATDLKKLLYLFSSPAGVILTGSLSSFTSLSLQKRQSILRMMKSSVNPLRRQAFRALVPLTYSLFLTVLDESTGINPNWEVLNYQLPPPAEQIPTTEKLTFININCERSLKADVVVIGSGAGGGVTAALLAEAGYSVIVLEKGSYVSPNTMTWKESEAYPLLYEQAGTLTTSDLSMNILAGSCLGGGTTVNWAASIRTPDHVLEEWRRDCPTTFQADRFNEALDKVSERLSVNTTQSYKNVGNELLSKALEELDFEQSIIPRNVKNCDATQCGYCSMGCRSKSKQSSTVSYLEDACAKGAQIITNCWADEITHTKSPKDGQMQVHGVVGIVTLPDGERIRIFIKASIVVSSAGAIHTPPLLLRSGLKNTNIGKNLHLHPVCPAIGIFDRDVEIWKGVPMSVVSKEFMSKNGTILEVPTSHLGVGSSLGTFDWSSSQQFKSQVLKIGKWGCFIPIQRDKDSGRVKLDRDGRSPLIDYTLSDNDWKNILPGLEGSLRALVKAGATQVCVPVAGLEKCESKDLEEYIRYIKSLKYKPNLITVFSAHQMGSCKMGSSRSNSVVNQNGESWDMKRLFIADGSVLPTAVGVNPMITIYAVSYLIAKSIIDSYPPGIAYERGN